MPNSKKSKFKEEDTYLCQFCEKESKASLWKNDKCPYCKKEYNVLLAQDSEE